MPIRVYNPTRASTNYANPFIYRLAGLLRIRVCEGDGAFCIIAYGPFYVQCLASVDAPEYLVEIVSHRSIPMVEACIDERAVAMLRSAGFRWPRGENNFSRYVPVRDAEDCADLADVALGTLHFLFGYRSGDAVSMKVHIPS